MMVLLGITGLFLLLELANVGALYLAPGSDKFNALGVFRAWEASKEHPEIHALLRYLAWWVAGTKLIFILLLASIMAFAEPRMKVIAVGALILSILSYFWRLHPLIRAIDGRGQLRPPGYSKTLGLMIAGFLTALVVALVAGLLSL